MVGKRFAAETKDLLVKLGIIEEKVSGPGKGRFRPGKNSIEYRFCQEYRGRKFRRVPIHDRKLDSRIERHRLNRDAKAIGTSNAREFIRQNVMNGLEMDVAAAREYVLAKEYADDNQKTRRLIIIDLFERKGHGFSTDSAGRYYHILTSLPRDLRRFVTWKGHGLFAIDVSNCQPALHATLYKEECWEKTRFIDLVSTNQFYGHLNAQLEHPYDLESDEEKGILKGEVFHHVFYGSPHVLQKAPLTRIFEEEFPILAELMREKKWRFKKDLPVQMQELEANIVLNRIAEEIICDRTPDDFCLISIHDCLVTTEENVEEVKQAMERKFEEALGFRLPVKAAPLSLGQPNENAACQLNEAA